jgi:hypothetical protein
LARVGSDSKATDAWALVLAGLLSVLVVRFALGSPLAAAVALGALSLGLLVLLRGPVVIAVLSVPAMWLAVELPGRVQGPDVLLTLGALLAVPALAGRTVRMRGTSAVRWAVSGYLAALVLTTIVHPSGQAWLEILQRAVITLGALAVGAWLATEDRHRVALRAFVLIGVPVGVVAAWVSFTSGFAPAYPLGLHKNYAGALLAASFLIAWCAREPLGLRGYRLWLVLLPTILGLIGCRSRGALLGLMLGLVVWFFHTHSRERRKLWWAAVVGAVGFGVFAVSSVVDDISGLQSSRNSSVAIRTVVQQLTVERWEENRVLGAGVRYWLMVGPDASYASYIPPINAATEALAEAGVVGGVAWLLMNVTVIVVLLRRRGPWATAAAAVFASRLLHLMTDQGWNAGTGTLPWLLAGIALAVPDERERRVRRSPASAAPSATPPPPAGRSTSRSGR